MKVFDFNRSCIVAGKDEVHEFVIFPAFTVAMRRGPEDRRMKYWFCRIDWLEWYVNITIPRRKKKLGLRSQEKEKDQLPGWWYEMSAEENEK